MKLNIEDNMDRLQGEVHITCTNSEGEELGELNLIVSSGKRKLLESLYGSPSGSPIITGIAIGSGGCIDPLSKYPKEEGLTQTALHTKISTIPVTAVPDLDNLRVRFLATLTELDAIGETISEIGLVTGQGGTETLFNVKNFAGITKTGDFSINIEWIVRFA